jgi:plastocyanin
MIARRKIDLPTHALALACAALLAACGGGESSAPAGGEAPAAAAPADGAAAPAGAPGPSGSASVTGAVTYTGEVPSLRPISMSADPACAAKHTGEVANNVLVLGDNQSLGNVFVYVKSGLPAGTWPAPAEPAVIDQVGCLYDPRVMGVVRGQEVKFLNSDGILHNVHALPKQNQEFNIAMPAERKEASATFDQSEDMFLVKCDVHPWMNAHIRVMDHPYFATTGPDGQFSIANLPAGTYEIEAWHERLGTQTQTVTVADGAAGNVSFNFQRTGG